MKRKRDGEDKYTISVDVKPGTDSSLTKKIFTGALWLSCLFIVVGLICILVGAWVFVKLSVSGDASFELKRLVYSGPAAGLFVVAGIVCFWAANVNFKAR